MGSEVERSMARPVMVICWSPFEVCGVIVYYLPVPISVSPFP